MLYLYMNIKVYILKNFLFYNNFKKHKYPSKILEISNCAEYLLKYNKQ